MNKEVITEFLKNKNYNELGDYARRDIKGVFRRLIGLAYDKSDVVCWRAIEAIGLLTREVGKTDRETVRNLAQRLLWMMRDESGNNPWSAPEMLGEIVRNNPDAFADIAPVIMSFHDELMLKRGVLRAAVRIAEKRPDVLALTAGFVGPYLRDEDPVVRAHALRLAEIYSLYELKEDVARLMGDKTIFTIYMDGDFTTVTVGETAERAYAQVRCEEK